MKKILILMIVLILTVQVVSAANVCVVVDYGKNGGENPDSKCVDIDENESYIGRRIKPLSSAIEFLFKHRGIFHSIFMALLIFLGFWQFGYIQYGYGFFVGYLSHLIADGLTVEGVRIFYPLSRLTVRGFARTNGIFEKIFFALVLVAIGYKLI